MSVYIDTSAFLAISNADDRWHHAAIITWEKLLNSRMVIVTANYVVVETAALLHRRQCQLRDDPQGED